MWLRLFFGRVLLLAIDYADHEQDPLSRRGLSHLLLRRLQPQLALSVGQGAGLPRLARGGLFCGRLRRLAGCGRRFRQLALVGLWRLDGDGEEDVGLGFEAGQNGVDLGRRGTGAYAHLARCRGLFILGIVGLVAWPAFDVPE